MTRFDELLRDVRACTACAAQLPLAPRPVLQAHPAARLLLASQAPGRKVHESGIPFDDASGERLRTWLGISRETFYDRRQVAIVPMAFCYPGTGASGDLPPPPECARRWRERLLSQLTHIELTVVIGSHALAWHYGRLGPVRGLTITDAVRDWRRHWPSMIALPHPSPRNNRWLVRNPWFEAELLPVLRARVAEVLAGAAADRKDTQDRKARAAPGDRPAGSNGTRTGREGETGNGGRNAGEGAGKRAGKGAGREAAAARGDRRAAA